MTVPKKDDNVVDKNVEDTFNKNSSKNEAHVTTEETTVVAETPAETPKIDLNDPRIQDAIRNARQEEKDKLYSSLGKKNTKLSEVETQLKEAKDVIAKLKASGEQVSQAKLTEIGVLSNQVQELHKKMDEQKEEFLRKEAASLEAIRLERVDKYRNKLLHESKGEIIEELLVGETEEELDASLVIAKQRHARIVQDVITREKLDVKKTETVTNVKPQETVQTVLTPQEIKKMSPAEYAKRRHELSGIKTKALDSGA